jgi:Protein of unknown function (DUF1800)
LDPRSRAPTQAEPDGRGVGCITAPRRESAGSGAILARRSAPGAGRPHRVRPTPRSSASDPRYRGRFGRAEAERLLWRAGFGPRPGQAERLARHGLDDAVRSPTHPRSRRLSGPAPQVDGRGLAPLDVWGHDVLWWLDRMVRSEAPLVERMTLVWHDWFATSRAVVDTRWMLRQNELLRRYALGDFGALVKEITHDPAMLTWLNGISNTRDEPNENYARELQELFCLGAGNGYTERDVRELARALTGWRAEWRAGVGLTGFRLDRTREDRGRKRIHGHRGRYDWADAAALVVRHPRHPRFFVTKLWSYFIPVPPPPRTRAGLERLYRRSGHDIRPVVAAILRHPLLYEGPRMVKPPVVYTAGLLRALGRGIDTDAWAWLTPMTGQTLFEPPNVAGWDDDRWLDTGTWRARWMVANYALEGRTLDPKGTHRGLDRERPERAVAAAHAFWGKPALSAATRRELIAFARRADTAADAPWKRTTYAILRQNALRMLLATSPDMHTS